MFKTFSILVFSFLLLFQTIGFAEETKPLNVSPEPQDMQEPQNALEVEEAKEEISEAQREADAAEAAELQEVGVGEEPIVD